MIYAFGMNDVINYHSSNRGARSLNLLNYVKNAPPPKNARHFDVLSKNVRINSMLRGCVSICLNIYITIYRSKLMSVSL